MPRGLCCSFVTVAAVQVTGPTDCSSGEVQLLGNYVNLGVHNAGSFGTVSRLSSVYSTKKLGLIADYDKNGFGTAASPGFSGDYFVPGIPLEGWLVSYTPDKESTVYIMNEGLMNVQDILPSKLSVTSDGEAQSVLWAGSKGGVEIKKVVLLGNNKLYFTTTVVIKNIGPTAWTNFYYMRTADPDQEKQRYGTSDTQNYVKYQPAAVNQAAYVNAKNPNTALVCAVGVNNYDFYLGIGTVNSHAKAAHGGNKISDPSVVWLSTAWMSYGGSDVEPTAAFASRMYTFDEAVHLAYLYKTVQPGEVVTLEYTHVAHQSELVEALNQVEAVLIVQPTDILSGQSATLSVQITSSDTAVTSCTFFLFTSAAGGVASWHQLATVTVRTASADSSSFATALARVDTSQFSDGVAELRVSLSTSSGVVVYRKSKAIRLQNTGLQLCFQQSDLGGLYPISRGAALSLVLGYCAGASGSYSLLGASFFLEMVVAGEVQSALLSSVGQGSLPHYLTVNAKDLDAASVGSGFAVKESL
ncbi:hypothetical protein B484DRAFT_392061 [Ochromonadaceae sp. CCMP2298]|nr:hypothetical protein B484DRAFT_392061 [Ochromonadaceae sp. CCMP2298]